MSEIDESVLVAIRERADGGVHVEDLLAGARKRGTRRRRVRHTLLGAGAAAAVLAIVGVVAIVPSGGAEPGYQVGASGGPEKATPTPSPTAQLSKLSEVRPPVASTAVPVSGGGQVGADPRLLHLDVTDPDATSLRWQSGAGFESLDVSRTDSWNNSFNEYHIFLGSSESALDAARASGREALPGQPTTEQITVNGKPATLTLSGAMPESNRYAMLRWQQAPGDGSRYSWCSTACRIARRPTIGSASSRWRNGRASTASTAAWSTSGSPDAADAAVSSCMLALGPGRRHRPRCRSGWATRRSTW